MSQAQLQQDGGTRLYSSITVLFKKVLSTYRNNRDASRTYHQLSRLSDRELNDIGIHRGMILDISRKLVDSK